MDFVKKWFMIVLAGVFVLLYTFALLGWLKPLSDVTIVTRLEPLIFLVIGYYFGRFPAQQHEQTLKDEIARQTNNADAAQFHRVQVQQEKEALEEKLKNVKTILMSLTSNDSTMTENALKLNDDSNIKPLRHLIKNAIKILNS